MARRRAIYLVALAGAAALIGGVVLASGSSVGNQAPDHPALVDDPPRHYAIDALSERLTQRFGVLRRAATAGDRLPKNALEVSATYGSIPDAARKARATAHGALYVIPGSDERICLMDQNGAGGCNRLDVDGDLRLVTTIDHVPWLADGEVEIQGLVPDGVRSVTVTLRDGGERTLDVVNNVFDGVLPGGPRTVTWDTGRALDAPWIP
jgi:hypothetical protein